MIAGPAIDGILQPGEGGLTGQIWTFLGQTITDQFEEGIAPQGGGIILILVATGNLQHPLADQGFQGVPNLTGAPVGNDRRDGETETEGIVGFTRPEPG